MPRKIIILLVLFFLSLALPLCSLFAQLAPLNTEYLNFVQQKINSLLIYPDEAIENGWEGIVTLKVTIAADGNLKAIMIAESSGYPILDEQAVTAVRDAGPYPLPEDYDGYEEVEIVLPLRYAISDISTDDLGDIIEVPSQPNFYEPDFSQPLEGESEMALEQEGVYEREVSPEELQQLLAQQEEQPATEEESPEQPAFSPMQQPVDIGIPIATRYEPKASAVRWPEELSAFIQTSLKNNKPTAVAQKEVDLAEFKVKEAMRNLLPTAKVSSSYTDGDYSGPYREMNAKIEVNQPIYYGGRLLDSIEHAKANLEVSKMNLNRLQYEIIHKTETAYYNLIASRTHWRYKEALRTEAQELLTRIQKLADIGMIIPLELKSAQSSFEQIEFQLASLKEDIYLAELTFKQVLNTKDLPEIQLAEPEVTKPNLNLDELFDVALKSRPEIYIGEMMVKFNKYGKKIELDKDNFAIDAVGSYEYYWGNYKTEDLQNSANWAAGIKVSKMLGASSLKSSFLHEKMQRRYGHTNNSETTSASAELGILDNFAGISSLKKADVDLHRSYSDLNETKKTITFEVQDSFLNYQKAILQLNTAAADMAFRRNQAEITKIRAMVNDASLSSAMDSLFSLADAQTKYFQALGNYFLALAGLKKATGYGINI
ncbi:MAG TPA: TonB family protein [Candidatus Omnitrophota bacterium]|nr:TonB family protein [Candidatus Omnitrophota bacterium]